MDEFPFIQRPSAARRKYRFCRDALVDTIRFHNLRLQFHGLDLGHRLGVTPRLGNSYCDELGLAPAETERE